jgi:hypothetical protein
VCSGNRCCIPNGTRPPSDNAAFCCSGNVPNPANRKCG